MTTLRDGSPVLAYSTTTACQASGLSRSQLDRAIRSGALKARKSSIGKHGEPAGKFVILAADFQAYLESLPGA